jgi:hypothetical protein
VLYEWIANFAEKMIGGNEDEHNDGITDLNNKLDKGVK